MDDLISRQAAIDAIENTDWYHQNANKDMVSGANPDTHQAWYKANDVYSALESVPSAQPEIIWCKDCRYSIDEYGDGECYCKRPSRELVWIGKRWDFFCAAARLKMEVEHE